MAAKPLTELQIEALRKIDNTPRSISELDVLPATMRSLETRDLVFKTSGDLYYSQGQHLQTIKKIVEEYDQKNQ